MTPFVVLFVSLAAFAVGAFTGWMVRERLDRGEVDNPEAELRALREVHSGCASRIRNLHLELAQLETKLSMSRVEQAPRPAQADVSEDELQGAARLASLIDVLESGSESGSGERGQPAAFMSILPADLVEAGAVKEGTDAADPESPVAEPTREHEDDDAPVGPSVVVSLGEDEEPVIELDVHAPDDLTAIKGIGPKIEAILHEHGITTFRQLADLDEHQIEQLGDALGSFRGRIARDDWVGAAQRMISTPAGR